MRMWGTVHSRPGMSVEMWCHLDELRVGEHNPPHRLVMHIYDGTHILHWD